MAPAGDPLQAPVWEELHLFLVGTGFPGRLLPRIDLYLSLTRVRGISPARGLPSSFGHENSPATGHYVSGTCPSTKLQIHMAYKSQDPVKPGLLLA